MHTNRLAKESSPYLLQHAHNPVDWFPWSDSAFEQAKAQGKPVLVSIGYAACHWCHVMERESFENEEVAAIMNRHFINIKVDREERPDVDHIYMDAVQAISGSGGWPLNVFLTPDRKPFYGGTYFPPVRAFNRASWREVLLSVADAWASKREELEGQAENLTEHLRQSGTFGAGSAPESAFDGKKVDDAFRAIMQTADREWGGFGRAPKFPQTFTISFLLQYAQVRKNEEALGQALLSLDKMIAGGIYDQIGGGFSRYSTDTEWLAPHFEKMLYDNALLVQVLGDAYQFTANETYRRVMSDTLAFVERELMHPEGGFFSALDADSEGVEGKFYVWTREEVEAELGEDAGVFCDYFDITDIGNWEGRNILRVLRSARELASARRLNEDDLQAIIQRGREKLLQKRTERIRPQLDDKVILGWNALMNQAYSRAYAATGDPHYLMIAERNMAFLVKTFSGRSWHHTWKNGEARHPAFLDDYANLIAALLELGQVSGKPAYFDEAATLTEGVLDGFNDEGSPLFFYTHRDQQDVPVRKKEVYDGATPSANAVMAYNLYRLSILFDRGEWRRRSEEMAGQMSAVAVRYPTSFGVWLALLFEMASGTTEIAIIGKDWKNQLQKVMRIYISHKLAQASANPLPGYPLIADKAETSEILFYVCKNYACLEPVTTIQDFVSLLHGK